MQGGVPGYPRVDLGLHSGYEVKLGQILKFYHVNRSSSGHYLGEVGTIGTLSGRAGGPIWLSKGGSGPVQWICGQSWPKACVLLVGLKVSWSKRTLRLLKSIGSEASYRNIYIDIDIARMSVML